MLFSRFDMSLYKSNLKMLPGGFNNVSSIETVALGWSLVTLSLFPVCCRHCRTVYRGDFQIVIGMSVILSLRLSGIL